MDIRNCGTCGKIYSYDGFKTCIRCRRAEEEEFKKVKDYIWDYPGAAISEVSEETEVSTKKIIEFLRQGRLEIKNQSGIVLPCEKCGDPISTGRFCKECTVDMDREFKGSIEKDKKSSDKDNKSRVLGSSSAKTKLGIAERYRKN